MTALLLVVAAVTTVGQGSLTLDKGSADGLRRGDTAKVYYELTVAGTPRRIDVGSGEVSAVELHRATVTLPAGTRVRAGYAVELRLPADRLAPPASEPGAGARIEDGSSREVELLRRKLAEATQQAAAAAAANARQVADLAARLQRAESALAETRAQLAAAAAPASAAPSLAPESAPAAPPPTAAASVSSAAGSAASALPLRMALLPAGAYRIGLAREAAEFYNEQPAHEVRLPALLVDLAPAVAEGASAAGGEPPPRTEVAFAEAAAACAARGARLPTEEEWEALALAGLVRASAPLLEWTASWYAPYPGNRRPEPEYGESMRVLRGSDRAGEVQAHRRRFLDPATRHPQVGFRCVVPQ
ncbi:MAG TPA: SUMF1/EgtB/PvdO family nonheme iron enzyme [Thermoanaerobaculia bacterium]|nr:SUMF1/EgtB/PvdO family nonheme iron enzyme [Thermoanaerobaculia bacterium]